MSSILLDTHDSDAMPVQASAFASDRIRPCCSSSFKSLSWKYKFELLQPVSFKGFAFFPSLFGYKIHKVLCFCSWSGVLIPSPLRDHSTFISVQGYPTAVQLLEDSFPGRNSISLSWWKSCFWSGTWFTCSFSFRLGEWHLPAGVRTFTFPFSVLKELKAPSLMIWAHGWQSVFYQQNTIPKNQSKTSWLRRKSEPRLWKSHCSSAFIDWAMALAHIFFSFLETDATWAMADFQYLF